MEVCTFPFRFCPCTEFLIVFSTDTPTHRPITSYGAIELPTYFIDLTPFVPVLADGKPHNISLDVASAESNHATNQNWFVSGLVQVRSLISRDIKVLF